MSRPRSELAWREYLGGVCRQGEPYQAKGEAEEQETTELIHVPSAMALWAEQEQKTTCKSSEVEDGSKLSYPSCKSFLGTACTN